MGLSLPSASTRALAARRSPPPPNKTNTYTPQAHIWKLDFAVAPQALADLRHELRVDERLLRWAVVKKRAAPRLPPPRDMFHRDPSFGAVLRPPQRDAGERALPDVSALFREGGAGGAAAGSPR